METHVEREKPISSGHRPETSGLRFVYGTAIGAIAATLFIVVVTIAGELYGPLKSFLAQQHHHHWVGKGIWASVIFVVFGIVAALLFHDSSEERTARSLKILSWMLIFSLIVLFAFFAYEYSTHLSPRMPMPHQ